MNEKITLAQNVVNENNITGFAIKEQDRGICLKCSSCGGKNKLMSITDELTITIAGSECYNGGHITFSCGCGLSMTLSNEKVSDVESATTAVVLDGAGNNVSF